MNIFDSLYHVVYELFSGKSQFTPKVQNSARICKKITSKGSSFLLNDFLTCFPRDKFPSKLFSRISEDASSNYFYPFSYTRHGLEKVQRKKHILSFYDCCLLPLINLVRFPLSSFLRLLTRVSNIRLQAKFV